MIGDFQTEYVIPRVFRGKSVLLYPYLDETYSQIPNSELLLRVPKKARIVRIIPESIQDHIGLSYVFEYYNSQNKLVCRQPFGHFIEMSDISDAIQNALLE